MLKLSKTNAIEALIALRALDFPLMPILDETGKPLRTPKGNIQYDISNDPPFKIRYWIEKSIRKLEPIQKDFIAANKLPPDLQTREVEYNKAIQALIDDHCAKDLEGRPLKDLNGNPARVDSEGALILGNNGERLTDTNIVQLLNDLIKELESSEFRDLIEARKSKEEESTKWLEEETEVEINPLSIEDLLSYKIFGNIKAIMPLLQEEE